MLLSTLAAGVLYCLNAAAQCGSGYTDTSKPCTMASISHSGSIGLSCRNTAVNTTITSTDNCIGVTAVGVNVTFPTALAASNFYVVQDETGNAAPGITIKAASGVTLNSAAGSGTALTVNSKYGTQRLFSNGANNLFSW